MAASECRSDTKFGIFAPPKGWIESTYVLIGAAPSSLATRRGCPQPTSDGTPGKYTLGNPLPTGRWFRESESVAHRSLNSLPAIWHRLSSGRMTHNKPLRSKSMFISYDALNLSTYAVWYTHVIVVKKNNKLPYRCLY
jgi:hypothetical protein